MTEHWTVEVEALKQKNAELEKRVQNLEMLLGEFWKGLRMSEMAIARPLMLGEFRVEGLPKSVKIEERKEDQNV